MELVSINSVVIERGMGYWLVSINSIVMKRNVVDWFIPVKLR